MRTAIATYIGLSATLLLAAVPGLGAQRVVTLDDVLRSARDHQPQLAQAHANTAAAVARVTEAFSSLLPQVAMNGSYQRTTANFVARPGVVPRASATIGTATNTASWDTFDFYNFGLNANQLVYDFGQTTGRWRAAEASAQSLRATEQATLTSVLLTARQAFFNSSAGQALVKVAEDTLANQQRHLDQIQGFVDVGTRPEIDLAQGRTDVANAKVQLINARNQYASAKAVLNQAMGIEASTDYEVRPESMAPVEDEDFGTERLFEEATEARPDLASLNEQRRSQEQTIRSIEGSYGPSFGVGTGFTDAGNKIGDLGWNWEAGVTMSWNLYQGGLTKAQVSEARANLMAIDAQVSLLRQQILVQVEQARLNVIANRQALAAAEEALVNAREQLRLAEGRYQTGVGSIIELGDAQVAATSAAAQRVQAEFNLASARAALVQALGRE